MASNALSSPLDVFWHDKNERLLAHLDFSAKHGTIYDDVWCFRDNKGTISRWNFAMLNLPHFQLM